MPTRWNLYLIRYVDLKEGNFHEETEAPQSFLDMLKLSEEEFGDIQVLSSEVIGTDGVGGKKLYSRKMKQSKKF